MRKWVYTVFQQKTKYDKTVYMENERFLTHKSIYIWNLLFKSFQMICRIISVTCLQQKWDKQIFWKQLFQRVISAQSKIGKGRKNVFFLPTVKKEAIGACEKIQMQNKYFRNIYTKMFVNIWCYIKLEQEMCWIYIRRRITLSLYQFQSSCSESQTEVKKV